MPSVPAAPPARRPLSRKLTIIAEGPYGHHQRLELLVPPGMTVAELPLDDSHPTLVQPGGGLLGRTDYLFEIAADTPRLFALYHPSPPAPQPIPSPQPPLLALSTAVPRWTSPCRAQRPAQTATWCWP